MQWYSASAWEHHILAHSKENLPIHSDDPAFSQQFAYVSEGEATPSTSGLYQNSLMLQSFADEQKLPNTSGRRKWSFLHSTALYLKIPIQALIRPQNVALNKGR